MGWSSNSNNILNDFWVVPNSSTFTYYNNLLDIYYTSSGATTNADYDNYINAVVTTINDPSAPFKGTGLTASYSTPDLTIKSINGGTELNGITIYKQAYGGSSWNINWFPFRRYCKYFRPSVCIRNDF
jgi:hypothetical protein